MLMKIKNRSVNYEYSNISSDLTLVFLHGWGQNIQMMQPVAQPFAKKFNTLLIDLPGHGLSEEPLYPWTVYDYVECVYEIIKKLKIKKIVLIGHSFGGKISLLYASKYQVEKLILFASPFKKEITKITLKTKILKQLKKVPGLKNLESFAKKHIGSEDYRNASELMRKILVNTVNLDIREEVKKIKCPTIIIWGTNDEAVDVKEAYELESLIVDSGTIIYEGKTHYAYLENLNQTINIMKSFLIVEDSYES